MLKWQSKSQEKKLPQLRRKLDKVAMEEGAQLCAVLTSLQADLLATHPIQVDEWNKSIVEPFIEGSDMNLLLGLQSVLHAKPECPVVELLPQFQEMLTAHTHRSDIALTGLHKTELMNAEIDKTEFDLFLKKFEADLATYDVFARKSRTQHILVALTLVVWHRVM